MPVKPEKMDWEKLLEADIWKQEMEAATRKLDRLDGRELYEIDMVTQMPDLLINRPVHMAMHRTKVNYPVKPLDIMRACLIDGNVILEVRDAKHIAIQKFVSKANYDPFTDELDLVEIKYIFEREGRELWHVEQWIKMPDGNGLRIVYKPMRTLLAESKWVVDYELMYPIFPFVGIPWVENESFLKKPKAAIIRLELAYRVIGVENVERMGLSLYIEGIRDVSDIKTAPRRMGRRVHTVPPEAKFHSPGSDAPGMELMVTEITKLHDAIEAATGVVTTERLSTLSGVSRILAEKPLIILAEEIRDRFTMGMQGVEALANLMGSAPPLKIRYRPLRHVEDKEKEVALLDRALEKGAIDDEEYGLALRELLDLPPVLKE